MIKEANADTQRAEVAAGYKGGEFFSNLIQHPAMTVKDGVPAEVKAETLSSPTPSIPMQK